MANTEKPLCPESLHESYEHPKTKKRPREDEPPCPNASPKPSPKRTRNSPTPEPLRNTFRGSRTKFWCENGTWPKEEEGMDRFRDIVNDARPRRKSLSRKRSNTSLTSETTQITGSMSRDQKIAPYRHPLFERQLKEYGSFMDDHELGITAESEELFQSLLKEPQPIPRESVFSNDEAFKKTCRRLKGENETKVLVRISSLIFPSPEILADQGAAHLSNIRETNNAIWANSIPFINGSGLGSRIGPRPQPDFGVGFDRDAFNMDQLEKLQPFLGDLLKDSSLFAATYQMYFPFLTCEVKCGDGGLNVADRQNVYAQSVLLRGLFTLYRLVGREQELHREINGFSLSHNNEHVRIWGHYVFIDGDDVKFYRHAISDFLFAPPANADQRWFAYTFVRNIYDLWLPKHYERLCSVIDMLPIGDFEVTEPSGMGATDPDANTPRSGLSQQLEGHTLEQRGVLPPLNEPGAHPISPIITIDAGSSNSKKKRTN